MAKEDDIREVIAEEASRGRRLPKDPVTRRQEKELLQKFRAALALSTEREFVEAIRELGFADDPEKLRKGLQIWRDYGGV